MFMENSNTYVNKWAI